MPKRTDIPKLKSILAVFVLVSSAGAQQVIESPDVPCNEETVHANLEVKVKQHISGDLKDQTGAPFEQSKVLLRKSDVKNKFVSYKTVVTDKEGHFDFGFVDSGKYRFLPSPHRGFKQPAQVDCFEGEVCEIKLVLEVNPTDQEFVGCPIQ